METKIFFNRHSDKILFERIDLLEFKMSGFMDRCKRITDIDGKILAFDPPGGPHIIENDIQGLVGTNMGQFNSKWKYFNVADIKSGEDPDSPSIIIECTYNPVIKWKKIKNPA
jgi:hypothetical protein